MHQHEVYSLHFTSAGPSDSEEGSKDNVLISTPGLDALTCAASHLSIPHPVAMLYCSKYLLPS